MADFQLILTSDYEVWGDGSGCVEKCVIEPAQIMMDIAEKYDARITFFLDVCEYWAFEKIESLGKFSDNYKPASLIKEQLQNAVRKGHDVQLHFHPQWLNYKFNSDHSWKLDHRYWKLPEVNDYFNNDWSIEKLFNEGIQTLNTLFAPVDSDYKVVAFRAGGWCIQPEENIVRTMVDSNIKVDSTVAPGRVDKSEPYSYDFSTFPFLPFWEVGKKITEKGNVGLLELPICTSDLGILDKINFKYQKVKYRNQFVPSGCKKDSRNGNQKSIISSLLKSLKEPWMLNFSDGTSYIEMRRITETYMNKFSGINDNKVPIVAISHPKTFGVKGEFEKFLDWIDKQPNISNSTIANWIDNKNNTSNES